METVMVLLPQVAIGPQLVPQHWKKQFADSGMAAGRIFRCARCKYIYPESFGCDDGQADLCDGCWSPTEDQPPTDAGWARAHMEVCGELTEKLTKERDSLIRELDVARSFHSVAVAERDYERRLNARMAHELAEARAEVTQLRREYECAACQGMRRERDEAMRQLVLSMDAFDLEKRAHARARDSLENEARHLVRAKDEIARLQARWYAMVEKIRELGE
jgi:hypothetical protein